MITCNVITPQFFWFKKVRQQHLAGHGLLSLFVNSACGSSASSSSRPRSPATFCLLPGECFHPTWVDICTYIGTFGLFLTLYLLFVKFCPIIAVGEVKTTLSAQRHVNHLYDQYLETHELEAQTPHGIA